MASLRYARLWQGSAWLLVLIVTAVTLMPKPPPLPLSGFLAADKILHLFSYTVLMCWFRQVFRPQWYWIVFLLSLGVALEFIQGWMGYRKFEYADMLANTSGVMLGLWLVTTRLGRVAASVDNYCATILRR